MKYFFIESLVSQNKLPIFVELRSIPQDINAPLIEVLYDVFNKFESPLHISDFKNMLRSGHYSVFLDGADEINEKQLDWLLGELDTFIPNYNKNTIVISSRPDVRLERLQSLRIFNIMPMTLTSCRELVSKLYYSTDTKAKFLSDLDEEYFNKHRTFLEIPLMTVIMLIVYGTHAEMPGKKHLFYKFAFEALYSQHDSSKGSFKRLFKSKLAIDDFSNALGAFCLATYTRREFSFTESQLIEYMRDALNTVNIQADPLEFVSDNIKNTCMLIQDGLQYTFTHRSFQEYFAADYFIRQFKNPEGSEYLLNVSSLNAMSNEFLTCIFGMDQIFFEKSIMIPILNTLFEKRCDWKSNDDQFLEIIGSLSLGICSLEERDGLGLLIVHEPHSVWQTHWLTTTYYHIRSPKVNIDGYPELSTVEEAVFLESMGFDHIQKFMIDRSRLMLFTRRTFEEYIDSLFQLQKDILQRIQKDATHHSGLLPKMNE